MINMDPFTIKEEDFLVALRKRVIEIRNPKDYIDGRDYRFYVENTKTFGSIPKIKFTPDAQVIKHEIMLDAGYKPVIMKARFKDRVKQAAKAFDSVWNRIFARQVRHGKEMAYINSQFTEIGQATSDLIRLIQICITPAQTGEPIQRKNPPKVKSYADEIREIE
jgi:hypothetical protein